MSDISRDESWLLWSDETGTQELSTDGEGNVICPVCAKPLVATTKETRFGCSVVVAEGRFDASGGRLGGQRVVTLVCERCAWVATDPGILRKLAPVVVSGSVEEGVGHVMDWLWGS